jgi:23S rRNA pseudouridine1911/1915/1917 synthase
MSAQKDASQLIITVDKHQSGERVDRVLTTASGLSRNHIQQLLRNGHIEKISEANAHQPVAHASTRVQEDELYLISLPPSRSLKLEPEDISLDILFEDDDLIVLNKPAGIVVHPSHGHDRGTLVHGLLHHCPDLPGINGVERPGIVHRLDKETSGSLVVAKSERAHRGLTELFANHELDRQYIAWCRGTPRWSERHIEQPIGRHPRDRQRMAVRMNGKQAITDAAVEHFYGPFSQLRLTLHTGRTHQIRVHLSHERLPILGDSVYARNYHPGNDIPQPTRNSIISLKRQALHAELLAFKHPVSSEYLSFSAPLPADLVRLSDAMKKNYG